MTASQGQRLITQVTGYRLALAAIHQAISDEDWTAIQLLHPLADAQQHLDEFLNALEELIEQRMTRPRAPNISRESSSPPSWPSQTTTNDRRL